MKALFLIKQELKPEDFYEFEPYLYGPCSFEVYQDLEFLVKENLIAQIPSAGRWSYYKITPLGKNKIKNISKIIDEKLAKGILEIKKLIAGKSIFELLHYVYSKYPEYAKNSIINLEMLTK
jgi:DNA-binding PadR family transcriptional regulator